MATMTRRLQTLLLLIAMLGGAPTMASGQTLTELGAANAARNDMMSNSAGKAAAAAPPASRQGAGAATVQTVNYGMKYTLSYALTGLLLALGMYLVCRPSNRNAVE